MATKYNYGEAEISMLRKSEEATKLVNNLTIKDFRTFCSTFGLDYSGSREELKKN